MKLHGKKLSGPNIEELYLPRPEGPVLIRAQGVASSKEFDKIFPMPKPPLRIKPGGEQIREIGDKTFQAQLQHYGEMKTHWMIIVSLNATPGLEWEKVKLEDTNTWSLWEEELRETFSETEVMKITQLAMKANGLDDAHLEQARKHFLALQEKPPQLSSQEEGQ